MLYSRDGSYYGPDEEEPIHAIQIRTGTASRRGRQNPRDPVLDSTRCATWWRSVENIKLTSSPRSTTPLRWESNEERAPYAHE